MSSMLRSPIDVLLENIRMFTVNENNMIVDVMRIRMLELVIFPYTDSARSTIEIISTLFYKFH